MLKQRWSPLQLTRTWGRHVPGRSKDGWDWKNHIIVARQRKTQGLHLRQPFCFLSTINALSLKDHPTGGTYSIKTRRKRGPKKAKHLQRPQDFLCAFVGRAGGDIATFTGIYNRLPARLAVPQLETLLSESGTYPMGCSHKGGTQPHPCHSRKPPSTGPASVTTLQQTPTCAVGSATCY